MKEILEKERLTEEGFMNICGLSGGGDSVYLLRSICSIVKDRGTILAVHINHCLRGKAADEDEEFCKRLCEELGVPFKAFRENVKELSAAKGQTLEQAGRNVRYGHFYEEAGELLKQEGCKGVNILLAHHKNDQEETVLMNFLRGSGPLGLSGMRACVRVTDLEKYGQVRLLRPLLAMTHKEITDALEADGFAWCEDATNYEQDYTRNKLRNGIIPAIKEISPGFTEVCCREARVFYDIYDYMSECAGHEIEELAVAENGVISFPAKRLLQLHSALRAQVIRELIKRVWPLTDVGMIHVEQIEELLSKESGRYVCLPGGREVHREFDMLTFGKREVTLKISDYRLESRIYPVSGSGADEFLKKIPRESYTKLFDYDTIIRYCGHAQLSLRTPKEGDMLIINREGQKKKLSVYLKQEKIPAGLRSETFVAAIGNVVLWVVGHRDSAGFFVTQETKNILELKLALLKENER